MVRVATMLTWLVISLPFRFFITLGSDITDWREWSRRLPSDDTGRDELLTQRGHVKDNVDKMLLNKSSEFGYTSQVTRHMPLVSLYALGPFHLFLCV